MSAARVICIDGSEPRPDVVTQSELREAWHSMEGSFAFIRMAVNISARIQERVLRGVPIEPGPLQWDREAEVVVRKG